MELIKRMKMKIAEQMKSTTEVESVLESSVPFEEVEEIISEEYPEVKLESEVDEEVQMIKSVELKIAGQFETVYIKPAAILCENDEDPRSEQSLEFSDVLLELNKDRQSQSICRLCANQRSDMIYMFNDNELYKNIIKKIEHCLPITVKETDILPKYACQICLEKLELFYQFQNSVAEAEKQLSTFDKQDSEKLKATEESRQSSSLYNGQRDARKHPNNDGKSKTSNLERNSNETTKPSDELQTTDSIAESDLIAPNLNLHSQESSTTEIYRPNNINKDKGTRRLSNKQHTDSQNPIRHYPCCFCNATFRNIRRWRQHYLEHWESIRFRGMPVPKHYTESNKKFIIELRQKFRKLYENSNTTQLSIPGGQLRTLDDRRKNDPAVQCVLCKKRFRSDVLEVHKETCSSSLSTKKKFFSCEYCRKKFDRKTQKTAHMRSHTRERPYRCNSCKERFKSIRSRNEHMKIHMGERVFKCLFCKKTFAKISALRCHARVHSEKRFRECPICKATFDTTYTRNDHIHTIHANEKLYQCDLCETYLRSKGNLLSHIRRQHEDIYF